MSGNTESLSLKWGSIKSWNFKQPKLMELLQKYYDLGVCISAALQEDTEEQRQLIIEMIDLVDCDEIYLHWEGKHVSKEEAKKYVLEHPEKLRQARERHQKP